MARLRLVLLGLAVAATAGCSSLSACFEPGGASCYQPSVSRSDPAACDCGGGPAPGLSR
jgi:hypothetical protein